MRRSEVFLPTQREGRADAAETVALLERAGLVRQFGAGVYAMAPAGQRVREKVADRVRAGMDAIGGQQVSLPALQYDRRWKDSGRWDAFENEMFTLRNRDGRAMCLAPSHEEGAVALVDGRLRSYDDLPLLLYQVETKYRDDHARNGLVRTKAFTMKDVYSFHLDEECLAETYREVRAAYERILADLGIEYAIVAADTGVMGGSRSEEFVAPAEGGGDRLVHCRACRFGVTDEHEGFDAHDAGDACPDCGERLAEDDAIEVGHLFQLGTRYSSTMGLTVDGPEGDEREVVMGSYGLGIERLLATAVRQARTEAGADGLRWPVTDWGSVAPWRAGVVPVRYEGDLREAADRLHETCGEDVLLFDDTDREVGERFAEADLLGLPAIAILGDGYRETGEVEIETADGDTRYVAFEDAADELRQYAAGESNDHVTGSE